MTNHKVVSRDEWIETRKKLLVEEKELTRRSDEVARHRQELPWVRIDKEYRFETDEGNASLGDLFRGRSQLLVYHFMFGPDYAAGCPHCSAIADGFNGSRAPPGQPRRDALGRVACGVDGLWGVYQWLDRAPLGRNESGFWMRRHDEYKARPEDAGSCCGTT